MNFSAGDMTHAKDEEGLTIELLSPLTYSHNFYIPSEEGGGDYCLHLE